MPDDTRDVEIYRSLPVWGDKAPCKVSLSLSIEGVLYLAAFGRGSRNCLDSNFETSMLYLAIAMIAARYEISTI
jgi:hypothetical protein